MMRNIALLLVLVFGCDKPVEPAQRKAAEPSAPASEAAATKKSSESEKAPSQDQLQCATLVAAYQAERNRQFGGDRATLRERLSKVGEQFQAQMKEIPGCNFPVP